MVDERNILQNLKYFAFPRLSGTDSEKEAFKLAIKMISDLGLDPYIQKFHFSTFFSRVYPKVIFFLGFLTVSLLFFFLYVPIIIILSIINGSIIISLALLMKNPEKINLYKYLESANLYVYNRQHHRHHEQHHRCCRSEPKITGKKMPERIM